jgi:hypothetical protein
MAAQRYVNRPDVKNSRRILRLSISLSISIGFKLSIRIA